MSSGNSAQAKRKEIYRYEAPWMVYAMNWSIRPDKRFRLALGSFVEEYNNKVRLGCEDLAVHALLLGSNRFAQRGDVRIRFTRCLRSSLPNNEADVDTRYGTGLRRWSSLLLSDVFHLVERNIS